MLLPVNYERAEASRFCRQADLKCIYTYLQFAAYQCLARKLSLSASLSSLREGICLSVHGEVPGRFGHI